MNRRMEKGDVFEIKGIESLSTTTEDTITAVILDTTVAMSGNMYRYSHLCYGANCLFIVSESFALCKVIPDLQKPTEEWIQNETPHVFYTIAHDVNIPSLDKILKEPLPNV